jgi:hypothetical protein
MNHAIKIYGRKIFAVSLIFNALLSLTCALSLLSGFYMSYPLWKPFAPFLIDGNFFWLIIVASLLNLFPAAHIGNVHTGRLWFHHFVYGFLVFLVSTIWILVFTPVSLISVFFIYTTDITVNVGRFFLLGGMSLVLDDLPDVHKYASNSIRWLRSKAFQARRLLHLIQCLMSIAVLYLSVAICLFMLSNFQATANPSNFILIGTLLVTSLNGLLSFKSGVWLKLKSE